MNLFLWPPSCVYAYCIRSSLWCCRSLMSQVNFSPSIHLHFSFFSLFLSSLFFSCIDIWLLRNAVCPNCKGAIFCPSSSSSSSSTQCSGNASERDCEEGEGPPHSSDHYDPHSINHSTATHHRDDADDLLRRGRDSYADSDFIFDEEAWIGDQSSSRRYHSPHYLREDSSRL